MSVTKEELEARDLADAWVGEHNIQIDLEGKEYWSLVEKVQAVVKDRDLMKKHADEGWKLANQRTAERQEILGALKSLLEVMSQNILITQIPHTSLSAARESAEAIVKKFKPLLEG